MSAVLAERSPWLKFPENKPEEGQKVLVSIHTWSMCTGDGKSWLEDNGATVHKSWFTNNPYPTEEGCFIDGFAISDHVRGTLHKPPRAEYFMVIPELL